MRRLMLLRHAKTERPAPGQRDRDRALTKRGRIDAPAVGAYMAHHGLTPDVALVSPAKRAQETWELMAEAFAKPPRLVNEDRIYNASAEALIAVIGEMRGAHSLLVVGHNPSLHDVATQLVVSGDGAARERLARGPRRHRACLRRLVAPAAPRRAAGMFRHTEADWRRGGLKFRKAESRARLL
jgi:phosphohistidine phosphatase